MTRLLGEPQQVRQAVEALKAMQAEHVFLEVYRGGHAADESVKVAEGSPLGRLGRLAAEDGSGASIEAHGRNSLKMQFPPRSGIILASRRTG